MKNIAERGCREINTAGGITECYIHVSQDTSSAIFSVVFLLDSVVYQVQTTGSRSWIQVLSRYRPSELGTNYRVQLHS